MSTKCLAFNIACFVSLLMAVAALLFIVWTSLKLFVKWRNGLSENEDSLSNQGSLALQPPGPPEPERPEGPQNTINVPSRQVHEPDSGPLQIDDQVRRHIYEYYSLI